MVWTVSSFTATEVLTSSEMNSLMDNFQAMTTPDSGAPNLYGQAWPTSWSTQGTINAAPLLYWYPASGWYILSGAGAPSLYISGNWRGSAGGNSTLGPGMSMSDGSTVRHILSATGPNPKLYWHKF